MNNDKLKGGLKQAEGSVKKALGEITNDKSKKAEGSVDKLVGAAQKSVGEVKDAIKKATK